VKFLTGTDEHGQKIAKAAEKAGVDPQKFTDIISQRFQSLVKFEPKNNNELFDNEIENIGKNLLNISNDDFIRTTEERHRISAQALWNKLLDNGHIYLDKYSGWYSVRDEAYYQESELIDGKAPTGADVEWIEESSYFFDLSKWQEKLIKLYEDNPDFIYPKSRYNEVMSFVKSGLKDLSISRTTFDWGVKVPNDPKHVMYVWIDALTNYLTAVDYPNQDSDKYKAYWNDADIVHVVGKDILRFHAVYWPAFLMAAELPLPKSIIAHGWWTIEGEKMSKSLGNVISPRDLVETYGLEQIRYFLLKAMPFGNDGDLAKERIIEICNADLANNIGNLSQRTLSMIFKNCDSKIPQHNNIESLNEVDSDLYNNSVNKYFSEYKQNMNHFKYSDAIFNITSLASDANEYIDKTEPWKLKKENPERMAEVLYILADTIRIISIMLAPFCPDAANKILDNLAVKEEERNFDSILESRLSFGNEILKPEAIFPRLEVKEISDVEEY
jgi:methionyl-tRNA synthetase